MTLFQLRRLRLEHKISLRKMAQKIKISPAYLSAIETGKKPLTAKVVWDVGIACGLSPLAVEFHLLRDFFMRQKTLTISRSRLLKHGILASAACMMADDFHKRKENSFNV